MRAWSPKAVWKYYVLGLCIGVWPSLPLVLFSSHQIRVVHAFQSGLQHRIERKSLSNSVHEFMSPDNTYDIETTKQDQDAAPMVSFSTGTGTSFETQL